MTARFAVEPVRDIHDPGEEKNFVRVSQTLANKIKNRKDLG
jgi:hypothetical protein